MSLSPTNSANRLHEDVLFRIFDQLDDEDLLRCETVCDQWRNVLLSGRPWRTLLRRKIVSSPKWRKVWRDFGVNEENLQSIHYRGICRIIIQEIKGIERNWRNGNFKKTSIKDYYSSHYLNGGIGCDYIALADKYRSWGGQWELRFLRRSNLEKTISVEIPSESSAVTNTDIFVVWDKKTIKIRGINGQLISEVPELDEDEHISWKLASCCITGDQMAVLSQTDGQENQLSLWDVSVPTEAIRFKSQRFNLDLQLEHFSMKMDEQFIAISTFHNKKTTFNFFSKKTLDLHWQKRFHGNLKVNFTYDMGLLLVYVSKQDDQSEKYGVIEVYDVTLRTYLREMRITARYDFETFGNKVGLNSKFMVVVHRNEYLPPYKMNIYDLKAVKDPNSSDNELLVYTLEVELYFDRIMVDDTAIICVGKKEIRILDFAFFGCFRNLDKSVTLSLPWRGVWRSKGVDEEPLEPVHHMEVYREVLKYFRQLSVNCQAAIETYPVVNPDLATFTLGDDFISYWQIYSKVVIYDEQMKKICLKTPHKSIQIRKNMNVSVIAKTIQLIDTATGDVINKMELEREAIGLHFSGNLLVSVSQLAENEHLLSVWKIENSVNLTRIKDLPIGDYHPHVSERTLQLDENFIAVRSPNEHRDFIYNLISLKTFQVETSLSSFHECYYDGGYLFIMKENQSLVRMLDVASGTFLRDMPIEPSSYGYISTVNSNYVVISTRMRDRPKSKLYVFDLKCLKETDSVPTHLLLTTIEVEGEVVAMRMNETRIVCLSKKNMLLVDLKPIDRLRCPESC